mmetsp:Transcript_15431/g.25003  ORF Transcript_15431/g.25003 Transcript_15431/m.25003 type:complete len:90 (-) Transcript_15431:39-308(-)
MDCGCVLFSQTMESFIFHWLDDDDSLVLSILFKDNTLSKQNSTTKNDADGLLSSIFFYVVKLLEDILLYLNTHQALDFVYQVTSYLCVN